MEITKLKSKVPNTSGPVTKINFNGTVTKIENNIPDKSGLVTKKFWIKWLWLWLWIKCQLFSMLQKWLNFPTLWKKTNLGSKLSTDIVTKSEPTNVWRLEVCK